MKYIWLLALVVFSHLSYSDEPSVKYQCESGFKEYTFGEKARFHICPNDNGTYQVDAMSTGGNNHSCWWPLTLSKSESGYSASEGDCKVSITFTEGKLNAQFSGACRSHCGARAGFRNGTFTGSAYNK
ncbi:hypothetical protein Q4519_17550 [Motilimonas sp. 1_MG-2023]|uniref:hypothetical protein n=1 Tax=Motilimonas sp. 1_MG-2023 TaxID=3062672 RepID=UPI0026E230B0|nr:hypothetical protein [Motilimonas sp. 1_MG-2023]MDO6527489.1 hypothetical protein [Motilimonas sp. 1_MG-2023]